MPRSRATSLFDRWSRTYDSEALQAAAYTPVHDAIIERLEGHRFSVVVDVGCGTGQLIRRLKASHPESVVIGLDFSPGMLDRARATPGHTLLRADAMRVPIRPGSVDLVTCTESFHWYPDQRAGAAELAAMLRPGGRLLIASIATVTRPGSLALERLTSLGGRTIRATPPGQLGATLERAGFEVDEQRRILRPRLVPWPVLTDAHIPGE